MKRSRYGEGLKEKNGASHGEEAENKGQAVEDNHLPDLQGRKSPAGIETIANSSATEHGETDILAEGIADKGGQGDLSIVDAMPDEAE